MLTVLKVMARSCFTRATLMMMSASGQVWKMPDDVFPIEEKALRHFDDSQCSACRKGQSYLQVSATAQRRRACPLMIYH